MPDHQEWTTATTPPSGNPTKCKALLSLMRYMRKAECQGEGAEPQAHCELTIHEYRKHIELLRARGDFVCMWKIPMQLAWQFSLVARGDDVVHLQILHLMPHEDYNFAMKTKVTWSKNVCDERACAPQILLAAKDTDFCVF